jgi:hypothetical protein
MMDERDATLLWQQLFRGRIVSSQTLAKAELLVDELPSESPLRLRFTAEINELRNMEHPSRSKKKG